jgi:hypothetical protein
LEDDAAADQIIPVIEEVMWYNPIWVINITGSPSSPVIQVIEYDPWSSLEC